MASVAIIGGGPAGLVSAKEALENGLKPTVFEKSNSIGGLWKPRTGQVWESMRTNISFHSCSFSDFPWKSGTPSFPKAEEVYQYLCDYAQHFQIPNIYLGTEVTQINRQHNKWRVEWKQADATAYQTFDHVLVCSGIFSKAFIPQIPGLNSFPGTIVHSKDYRFPEQFRDKEVVVVGNAFSGSEIAAEIATTANKVTHLLRRPAWIIPRHLTKWDSDVKLPADLIFYSRAAVERNRDVSELEQNKKKQGWFKTFCARQEKASWALQVTAPAGNPHFTAISDTYLDQVEAKRISVDRIEIAVVEENRLKLDNDDSVGADAVVFCTGYRAEVPFLPKELRDEIEFQPDDPLQPFLLLHATFPPNTPDIAFVGMFRGPFFGMMELQARNACMTFAKRIDPPSAEEIRTGIAVENKIRTRKNRTQFPHGDYVRFCDHLAQRIGALPNFEQMRNENPELYEKIWNGPFTPASFRLEGPGSNPQVAHLMIDSINALYATG
jgi:dimethylaniline monooxygenase (N-oxide forming)